MPKAMQRPTSHLMRRHAVALAVLALCTGPLAAQGVGGILPPQTVPVLRGVVSGQAIIGLPTPTASGQLLTIQQSSARAVIDWKRFDIGSGSEVRFNQPDATAQALNRIFSLDPSVIQGKLTANGQVLLINQNGILFDRGAQVNVNALVASTLNIAVDTFNKGLSSGRFGTPAFEGGYDPDGDGSVLPGALSSGAIRIGAGGPAQAAAPTITAGAGGSIMLFAPVIENSNGVIRAPDGQLILAAGNKVYLNDPDPALSGLRGLLVEVKAEGGDVNLSSLIRNQGSLSADRGNVTLAALAINNEGRVSASSAVLYNGSVFLKAGTVRDGSSVGSLVPDRAGAVTIGAAGVVDTPLDTSDRTTMSESQAYASALPTEDRRGAIRIEAQRIVNEGRIEAPGGKIELRANDLSDPGANRIYLGSASRISAAGSWTDLDANANLLKLRITGNELKDSPLQKDGPLRGQTVTVDLRQGSALLDLSGYQDGRQRSVSEKASLGGEVLLSSDGSLVQRPGAVVDVSGGGYRYGPGVVATTRLWGEDGKVYDIGTAPKDIRYVGLLDSFTKTYTRWGQTQVWTGLNLFDARREAAYSEGRQGGALQINVARGLVLDGVLTGGATVGARQLAAAPLGASLRIDTNNLLQPGGSGELLFVARASDTLGAAFNASSVLSEARATNLALGTDTLYSGATPDPADVTGAPGRFSQVDIAVPGRVSLPADVNLAAGTGSSLALTGTAINIAGSVRAPAGRVTLVATGAATSPERGVVLAGGALVSTAGVWINGAGADGEPLGAVLPSALVDASSNSTSTLDGGSINLTGTRMDLQRGGVLDVSGGASLGRNRRVTGGSGGTLSISADAGAGQMPDSRSDAELRGFGVARGGTLNLSVGELEIGTRSTTTTGQRVGQDWFGQGGFERFGLTGARGLTVAAGTRIEPEVLVWTADPLRAASLPSGGDLRSIVQAAVPAPELRRPGAMTLRTTSRTDPAAVLSVEPGASITTGVGGSIALSATAGVQIDGRLQSPGGRITVNVDGPPDQIVNELRLGSAAQLLADGAFVARVNDTGLRQGTVSAGGSVALTARNARVTLSEGSQISVNGIARELDLAVGAAGPGLPTTPTRVSAAAGTVLVTATDGATIHSQLSARAPDASTAGGAFALELTRRNDGLVVPANALLQRDIVVTQSPGSANVAADAAGAVLSANALMAGGFDKLRLQAEDRIELRDGAKLEFARGVRLDTPDLSLAGNGAAEVRGASVVLANSFGQRQEGGSAVENTQPSAPVATRSGNGSMRVEARTLDVYGDVTLTGMAQTTLAASQDLRLSGRAVGNRLSEGGATLVGSLVSGADITLQAAQVTPSTLAQFTVAVERRRSDGRSSAAAGGTLAVQASSESAGAALSAGGSLNLRADRIIQAGKITAPLGQIALQAGSTLELASGSLTSVSATGQTLPFGSSDAGVRWVYSATNANPGLNDLQTPPAKAISLSAPSVVQRAGALVDLSGGGDLLATEFVRGQGGSADVLLQPNTFAIIPTALLSAAPVDGHITTLQDLGSGPLTQTPDRLVYDSLVIGAGTALPAGAYTLLPGRYALLPGAFLVQLQTGAAYSQLTPGQQVPLANGQTVVAGYRTVAGTAVRESRSVGVIVRPGSAARNESDYNLSNASFFARLAEQDRRAVPALPADAGAMAIAAGNALVLDGRFATAPAGSGARLAQVDISSDKLAVVDRRGQAGVDASFVQIEAASLTALQASVLLGGIRSDEDQGAQRISARASELLVANTSAQPLRLPELLLVASDRITVKSGSSLAGDGAGARLPSEIRTEASGALLRLAGSGSVPVSRGSAPDSSSGSIEIEAGATLKASGALVLDATRNTRSAGTLNLADGASAALAASSITLGDSAIASSGLALSNAQLAELSRLAALELKSYSRIDLLAGAQVGASSLKSLTLDAPLLQGVAAGAGAPAATGLAAGELVLKNSTGGSAAPAAGGPGTLLAEAERIVLAEGSRAISGYDSVRLNASGDLLASGRGELRVGAALTLESARIVSLPGAEQTWRAVQDLAPENPQYRPLTLLASGAAPVTASEALGGRLSLQGSSVDSAARIVLPAGSVTLQALGADGVRLRDGASINVSAGLRSFNDSVAAADAGQVTLSAAAGTLRIDSGARLIANAADTRAATGRPAGSPGRAGSINLVGQSLQLDGTLSAAAAPNNSSSGSSGGSFTLDSGSRIDLPALAAKLDSGGFFASRDVRQREGDLSVSEGTTWRARHIALSADAGSVRVQGQLDASGDAGAGQITLNARDGLQIGATALLDASGRGSAAGGVVQLDTRNGLLAFDSGARIDVRAGEAAATAPGRVTFTAPRTDGAGVQADLRGTVLGARTGAPAAAVVLEGRRVLTGIERVDADLQTELANDNATFIAQADKAALLGGLRAADNQPLAGTALRGALELQSAGDMLLESDWNLTSPGWLASGAAGTLTLRAAGNLTLRSALGLGDDDLVNGATWNLRLVGGADPRASNAMATAPVRAGAAPAGDVLLDGAAAKLRSGTGSISIAAARDFRLTSDQAVVWTAGVAGAPNPASSAAQPNPAAGVNAPWSEGGGDIRISAGRDAVGESDQWLGDWLRRPRGTLVQAQQSGWWAYRPNFRQNIASFGGGDISVQAGRDIEQLSAMGASSGRVTGIVAGNASQAALEVRGGGALQVQAGGDIKGGEYLLSRGAGSLSAGGTVGQASPTQLYIMGASDNPATRQASLQVQGGQGVYLQSVDNPSALGITVSRAAPGASGIANFGIVGNASASFYSYAPDSSLAVAALSGDLVLGSRPRVKTGLGGTRDANVIASSAGVGTAYPPLLSAVAFEGSIRGGDAGGGSLPALTLFPSTTGGAAILARQDITDINLKASDRLPASVPAWNSARDGLPSADRQSLGDPRIISRPATPGFVYELQATQGDIRNAELTLPARARVRAGRDIADGGAELQNLAADDLTVVQADGGDVRPGNQGLSIGGPGRLLVQAGRNAEVQTTVTGTGNNANPSLTGGRSARITVVAGVKGDLDLTKLDAAYAALIEAGSKQDAKAAEAAMRTVFGTAQLQAGDINSYLSSVQTTGDSEIDLLAPRGNITVGLTSPRGQTVGTVTNAGGAVRSYLEGSFNINQGKVVTAQGGDILIFTTQGNIDAGRGARTSVTTPAPRREPIVGGDGSIVGYRFVLSSGVAGSGIQTVTSDPDGPGPLVPPQAGNVYLFAPAGFVDAGEAGIASGANIVIAAQAVLNAANISASGSSVGVPVVVAGSLASSLATSGASTGGGKAAEDAAAAATAAAKAAADAQAIPKPTILTVEVLGFGERNCKESQKDCFAK